MHNKFFKATLLVVTSIILILAVSCSGDVSDVANTANNNSNTQTDGLSVITNIKTDGNPEAKTIGTLTNTPSIVGVLLKYQDEGLYNPSTSLSFFKAAYNTTTHSFVNPNAFYLEYLYGTEETWYGMQFNYVLYIPTIIRTVYESGGGRNPNSGNGFWWYMSTYYGKSVKNIRNNWEYTLAFLLSNRIGLEKPKASDVKGSWKANYEDSVNTSFNNVKMSANIGVYYYGEGENRDYSTEANEILFFPEGRYYQKSSKGDGKCCIFVPSELEAIYFAGSGIESLYQALLWYLETYYDIDAETAGTAYKNGQFGTLLEGKTYVSPKVSDIKQVKNIIEVSCEPVTSSYQIASVSLFYASDILTINGEAIQNKERVYYSIEDGKISIYYPEGYIEQMKAVYEGKSKTFRYNGDLLWNYSKWFCTSEVKGDTSSSTKTVSAGVINQLLNYRVSTGLGDPLI